MLQQHCTWKKLNNFRCERARMDGMLPPGTAAYTAKCWRGEGVELLGSPYDADDLFDRESNVRSAFHPSHALLYPESLRRDRNWVFVSNVMPVQEVIAGAYPDAMDLTIGNWPPASGVLLVGCSSSERGSASLPSSCSGVFRGVRGPPPPAAAPLRARVRSPLISPGQAPAAPPLRPPRG